MSPRVRTLLVAALPLLIAAPLLAQVSPEEMASQRLGRPYINVFIGYAAAWILVGGWVISIARRLARVEKRLGGD